MLFFIIKLLGTFCLCTIIFNVIQWARFTFGEKPPLKERYRQAGDWAIVTGASDGIGKAIAIELSSYGFNVALIARTVSKLEEVAAAIVKNGQSAKVLPFDFLSADEKAYDELFENLGKLEFSVLVNNVGMVGTGVREFATTALEMDLKAVTLNVLTQIRMTKFVLKHLKGRRCGGIINLSSIAARIPTPLLSIYAGTKAFNKSFSESLQFELAEYNIDVLTVTPGRVCSLMTGRDAPSFDCPAASDMAADTVKKLAASGTWHGHRNHEMMYGGIKEHMPFSLLGKQNLSRLKKVRDRQLRRETRQASSHTKND